MQKFFNHIMVPVNFNRNTTMVVKKAVEVANYFECDIVIMHVQTPMVSIPFLYDGHFSGALYNFSNDHLQVKMDKLLAEFRPKLKYGLLMEGVVTVGSWYNQMKELIIKKHIDLVVLPKHKKKFFGALVHTIDVNQLAHQTHCPVLTVNKQFNVGYLHQIVVPVDTHLPIRKLTAATCLAQKENGVIHLLGYSKKSLDDDSRNTRSLTRSYQLLRDHANVKVFCSSQEGSALADDTLAYARKVQADLIVINSGKESVLKGWFSRWIGKYLYRESNIPVLTIAPAP